MEKREDTKTYIVTFTDLVYASLLAYALDKLDKALGTPSLSLAFLIGTIIFMIFDWYGDHSLSVQRRAGTIAITLDFIAMAIYFAMIYSSVHFSIYYLPLMGLRGLRGMVFNYILIKLPGQPYRVERLKSYNLSSGFMFLTFTVLFIIDASMDSFSELERFLLASLIWLLAYGVALISEKIYSAASWWKKLIEMVNDYRLRIIYFLQRIWIFIQNCLKMLLDRINEIKRVMQKICRYITIFLDRRKR